MFTGNIVLIGFMGTGKTTIGRLCAEKLSWDFVDTDQYIEQFTNQRIPELFRISEAHFRAIETQVFGEILSRGCQVVSTGGGIVTRPENRELLASSRNLVFCLTARPNVILRRVKTSAKRPLLDTPDPKKQICLLLKQRNSLYQSAADYRLDTSDKSIQAVVADIMALMEQRR